MPPSMGSVMEQLGSMSLPIEALPGWTPTALAADVDTAKESELFQEAALRLVQLEAGAGRVSEEFLAEYCTSHGFPVERLQVRCGLPYRALCKESV
jgi:hypothetical protein